MISPLLRSLARVLTLVVVTPCASALTIQPAVFDAANSPVRPAGDPDGLKLKALADAAGDLWETLLVDPDENMTVSVRYDAAAAEAGTLNILSVTGGKAKSVRLRVRPGTTWYFDPTPETHSEFLFAQTFPAAYDPLLRGYPFRGSPPSLLEVGYRGTGTGSAASGRDLYSTLAHLYGRALGFSDTFSLANTELSDDDVDIATGYVNGAVMAVTDDIVNTHDDYSLSVFESCLNQTSVLTSGRRTLPSALDIMVVARCGGWTQLRIPRMDFLATGTQFWSGISWTGGTTPRADTAAYLRQTAATTVTNNTSTTVRSLYVSGSTGLSLTAGTLTASESATVAHDGNAFHVTRILTGVGATLSTPALNLAGGTLEMAGGTAAVSGEVFLTSSTAGAGRRGRIQGYGTVSANSLTNSGEIRATGGEVLTFTKSGVAPSQWDLDGNSDPASTIIEAVDGSLQFTGMDFAGEFAGTFTVGLNRTVTLPGWTLASGGRLRLEGGALTGGRLDTRGTITVTENSIAGDGIQFLSGSVTTISSGRVMETGGLSLVQAGARITGGELQNRAGGILIFASGSSPGSSFTNYGTCIPGGPDPASASVAFQSAVFAASGSLQLTVTGSGTGATADALTFAARPTLSGRLDVDLSTFSSPANGQRFPLLTCPAGFTGTFTSMVPTGLPVNFSAALDYQATRVDLVLSSTLPTVAEWIASQGVPAGRDGAAFDHDGDGIPNGIEAFTGQNPALRDGPLDQRCLLVTAGGIRYPAIEYVIDPRRQFRDAELVPAQSDDAQNWTSVKIILESQVTLADGRMRIVARSTLNVSNNPRRFFRLEIQAVNPPL